VYKVNNIEAKEAFFLQVWETFAIAEDSRWYLERFSWLLDFLRALEDKYAVLEEN
jgi:hypothetical protein